MQEAKSETSAPSAVVAGGIGGVLLLAGSFLTWATVSLNVAKFAQLLHVSEASIAAAGGSFSTHVAGTKADGKYTVVLGIVVIVGAVIAFTNVGARKIGGLIMAIGGAIGALIPVIEIITKTSQIDSALGSSSAALTQAGISADVFKSLFSVTWGIGLWACLLGGVVALVGGVMSLRAIGAATSPVMDMGAMPPATAVGGDMGFGTSSVGGSMAAPVSPPPPMDAPAMPTPASPPAADPAPPATDTTSGDTGGGTATP
jgi:hypothetical protein